MSSHTERSEKDGSAGRVLEKRTAPSILAAKGKRKLVALTAYDFPTARLLDESDFDVLLVGDSASNVMLGLDSTLPITLDEMLMFTRAVSRGARHSLVVGDMPFGSYHVSTEQALASAIRFVKEGNAGAVKLEGGSERAAAVRAIAEAGIPVMGHIGLRPQAMLAMGGFKVQGRDEIGATRLRDDAQAIADAGAFALVLEGVPSELGKQITAEVSIPTIGIGAGPDCDGQILVLHDLLGLGFGRTPKFVRRYADIASAMRDAFARYRDDVRNGGFPGEAEAYR